jgi:hypothetical protein
LGRVILAQAFADWSNRTFQKLSLNLIENNFQLIHTPNVRKGKNSSDISLITYGIETILHYPHIDIYVLVSGDSDFRPFIQSLRRSGKKIYIVCDTKTADESLLNQADGFNDFRSLIQSMEDEIIEDVEKDQTKNQTNSSNKVKYDEVIAFKILNEAIDILEKDGKITYSSLVKTKLKILLNDFDERDLGYNKWSDFIEAAGKKGYITFENHEGNLILKQSPEGISDQVNPYQLLIDILKSQKNTKEWADAGIIGIALKERNISLSDLGFKKVKDLIIQAEIRDLIEVKYEGISVYIRLP